MWAAAKLLFSGAAERLIGGLSAAFNWMLSDWRNGPLVVFAFAFAVHAFLIVPKLREARDGFERLWFKEQWAHQETENFYRAAAVQAEADAKDNVERVTSQWRAINQEQSRDFQNRLGALRERYNDLVRLRAQSGPAGDPRGAAPADLPAARAAAGRTAKASGDPQFPSRPGQPTTTVSGPQSFCPAGLVCLTLEEALIASEQAVQLDALITVGERQTAVPVAPVEVNRAE